MNKKRREEEGRKFLHLKLRVALDMLYALVSYIVRELNLVTIGKKKQVIIVQ